MKFALPALLIIISVGLFFVFTDEAYQDAKTLEAEQARFDEALERSKELQAVRDALLSRYNTFSTNDLERIEKLLPDGIDVVRLILELDSIASQHGMRVDNISVQERASGTAQSGAIGLSDQLPYETVVISFSVTAEYDEFVSFMEDLETSLRIVDLQALSLNSSDDGSPYGYSISLKTYWLQ